jgi:hypothetical protein
MSHDQDTPARDALLSFVREIAETRKDGDDDGQGEEYALENDDAWETLMGFVDTARSLLGMDPYPLQRAADASVPQIPAIARERLLGEGLRELERCCPGDETVLVGITGSLDDPQEIEFLGTSTPSELYVEFGWINEADEVAFTKAGELIVRALTISLPPYLRACDDGSATYAIDIADTTYGQTLRR